MSFTSFAFLAFVLASLFLYYILPLRFRWVALLLASFSFYYTSGGKTIFWLILVIILTYLTALLLERQNQRGKLLDKTDKIGKKRLKSQKKAILTVSLLLSIGLLFMMKYFNFTLEVFHIEGYRWNYLVPLGLSFFIFQSISYTVDVYRGKYSAEKNPLKLALFVSFFPQIVQGPIGRYDLLSPTLLQGNVFNFDQVKTGIQLCMRGYFKKIIIADRAFLVVSAVILEETPFGGAVVIFAMLLYCIQLYCDFSGGIDVARGVARLFGVNLAENFKAPLFSTSLVDFWRRWHITLGAFMREYLFYPISLSKPFGKLSKWARKRFKGLFGKIFATSLATFIVYFVIGIWHGANFKYVAFGFYNGILITASMLAEARMKKITDKLGIPVKSVFWRGFQMCRTGFIVFIGRYLTCAPSLSVAFLLLYRSFFQLEFGQLFDGTLMTFSLSTLDYSLIFLGIFVIILMEYYEEYYGSFSDFLQKHLVLDLIFIAVPLVILLVYGVYRDGYISASFIYQQY